MSIDDRLRSGLAANTDQLVTDPTTDRELAGVLRRARRRHRVRLAAGLAVLAAVVVAAGWAGDVSGRLDSGRPPEPVVPPTPTTLEPRSMENVDGPLEAGHWLVPLFGSGYRTLPWAEVVVPEGYGSPGGWVVDRGADGDPENFGSVSFWTVTDVASDPCRTTARTDPGPGVGDLARALHHLTGPRSTRPTATSLDGHPARYLEVTFPDRLTGCTSDAYTLWFSDTGMSYSGNIARTVARLWILDVDGTRVVVVADTTPHETPAEAAEVVGIASSTHFTDPSAATR